RAGTGPGVEPAAPNTGQPAIDSAPRVVDHLGMASDMQRKRAGGGRPGVGGTRAARDESIMREVRGLLRGDRLSQRFRRLDRMESAARVWVNGRPLGSQPAFPQLSESYD